MWKLVRIGVALFGAVLVSQVVAQHLGRTGGPGKDTGKDLSNSPLVTKMMAFDKNKDGKLTKDEVTDVRLHRLFDRADANKDGVVTKEELMALAAALEAEYGQEGGRGGPGPGGFGGPGGPGGGGPGGPGGRGGRGGRGLGGQGPGGAGPGGPGAGGQSEPAQGGQRGPGGFAGPGGLGGPPRPGQILPPFLMERLNLTADQKKQLEQLQKEIDSKLGKILTEEQKKQLEDMRRGPGGPGGFGPGGPPPAPGEGRELR